MDIHKQSWKIYYCTDLFSGKTLNMPPNPSVMKEYFERHFKDCKITIAYEAGCCGYSSGQNLQGLWMDVYVLNPADIPKPSKQHFVKTDKVDYINIAKQLKNGHLKPITIPDIKREQLRFLFRRRISLAKDFRKIKSQIKIAFLYHGVAIPKQYENPNWSHVFINWIIDRKWEYVSAQKAMDSMIYHYRFLDKEIRLVSNDIREYCQRHYRKDYYLLKSIPGIAGITAAAFISEAGI